MGNNPVLNADPMGDDYWSTSDPDQIASFMNAIGSQASQYDFSGWEHSTDQYDADGKMSYDDELMKLYYSTTNPTDKEVIVYGRVMDYKMTPVVANGKGYPGAKVYEYGYPDWSTINAIMYDLAPFSSFSDAINPNQYFDGTTYWDVNSSGRITGRTPMTGTPPDAIGGPGGVGKTIKTLGKSINQLNKLIKTGKVPKSIKRFDKGKDINQAVDHVHFKDGSALRKDGVWRHGQRQLTNEETKFLKDNGWTIP